jgi:hypothetical protein
MRYDLAPFSRNLATQMRVLHEDVIGRIAVLQEGLSGAKRRPRRK